MNFKGLYLHIPFCTHRCGYCDFNTYDDKADAMHDYVLGLEKEIRGHASQQRRGGLRTLFFGGGTPSLLAPDQIGTLIKAARKNLGLKKNAEITLEANPGTVDKKKLEGFREAGINRLSFGFQAAQDSLLKRIERDHDQDASDKAWAIARTAGFDNMSLDLMFGLPNQSMDDWESSLEWALGLEPEHISFYGLTVEPGTPFAQQQKQGLLPLPVEEIQAQMYEEGIRRLEDAGLKQYEISNFAREGRQSIHNRFYWENAPTLGLGAGAWSYDGQRRWGRVRLPDYYAKKALASEDTGLPGERLQGSKALGEAAMLGLRLLEGISLKKWRQRTGREWMDDFGSISQGLCQRGLLRLEKGRIRLEKRALALSDEVFSQFV